MLCLLSKLLCNMTIKSNDLTFSAKVTTIKSNSLTVLSKDLDFIVNFESQMIWLLPLNICPARHAIVTCLRFNMIMPKDVHDHAQSCTCTCWKLYMSMLKVPQPFCNYGAPYILLYLSVVQKSRVGTNI